MKRVLAFICLILLLCSCNTGTQVEELGIPLLEQYPEDPMSRLVWDMHLLDGKLYVGSGNYDKNSGPVDIWYYDLNASNWNKEGTLPDEEINRFLMINGKLTIPGTDPRDDWGFGNYYVREESGWKTYRDIPGGIHCFDIVEFDDALFFGLGVTAGETPIARSADGGKTFESVPMKKAGKPLVTDMGGVIRSYNFFVFGGDLYALFTYVSKGDEPRLTELYKYNTEKNEFWYADNWQKKVPSGFVRNTFACAKVTVGDTLFFTTGALYKTKDMKTIEPVNFKEKALTVDLIEDESGVYALRSAGNQKDGYTISVWKNIVSGDFEQLFEFKYGVAALCFEKDGNYFYFGMGEQKFADAGEENLLNGMVLRMKAEFTDN